MSPVFLKNFISLFRRFSSFLMSLDLENFVCRVYVFIKSFRNNLIIFTFQTLPNAAGKIATLQLQ